MMIQWWYEYDEYDDDDDDDNEWEFDKNDKFRKVKIVYGVFIY